MTQRSGAHALVESLLGEELDVLFGIPGVGTLAVYDAFLDHPGLRAIGVRHEQAAIFMADGFARSSGRIGLAFTSGGPGALNTLTAMSTAFNDSVPVLHLTSENPATVRRKGRGHFHDIADQFGVFRPVTGFGFQATLADEIPTAIHAAAYALRNRRARPALVEVAQDAFSMPTDAAIPAPALHRAAAPQADETREAAAAITSARRPIIWVGGGAVTAGAADALVRLAELTGAPVLTSQKGKGALPASHPLHVGGWAKEAPVRRLIDESDLLIAVGTRFSYFPTAAWTLDLPPRIVHIDADPAEIGRNYAVEVGVVADARLAVEALLDVLAEQGYERRPSREQEVAEALGRIRAAVGRPVEIDVLDQIRSVLPQEARVFNDPTTLAFWARSHWTTDCPRTWTVPSGFGTLGYALPAAIGGKVATPDHPSVAVIGDAGVMFTIQDLMTAVQERIPVIVLVFNDEGYGVERRHQDHLYGRRSGVDIRPPDFVALAESFGARGLLVEDLSRVGDTVAKALEFGEPTLIEVPNRFSHPGYGSVGDWSDREDDGD